MVIGENLQVSPQLCCEPPKLPLGFINRTPDSPLVIEATLFVVYMAVFR